MAPPRGARGFLDDNGRVHPEEDLLPDWQSVPVLAEGEVQVFALRVDSAPDLPARAHRLLSAAEAERAARIRVPGARDEFVVGRAALRALAGRATGNSPASVHVVTDTFGKPHVRGVHCNVTHSHGLIYVALCRTAAVGIDVEWVDPALEALELAQTNFRAEETAVVAAAEPGRQRAEAFCKVWTRKEAVAKAHGQGLRLSLCDIVLPVGAEGFATVSSRSGNGTESRDEGDKFYVRNVTAPKGFAASMAVQGGALPAKFLGSFQHSSSVDGIW